MDFNLIHRAISYKFNYKDNLVKKLTHQLKHRLWSPQHNQLLE